MQKLSHRLTHCSSEWRHVIKKTSPYFRPPRGVLYKECQQTPARKKPPYLHFPSQINSSPTCLPTARIVTAQEEEEGHTANRRQCKNNKGNTASRVTMLSTAPNLREHTPKPQPTRPCDKKENYILNYFIQNPNPLRPRKYTPFAATAAKSPPIISCYAAGPPPPLTEQHLV